MQTKSEIRKKIMAVKKSMTESQINELSSIIAGRLTETKQYIDNENILIYVSYNQEVKTMSMITEGIKAGKHIYVPKVLNGKMSKYMEFIRIYSLDELTPGYMGIMEPASNEYSVLDKGLVVMPGIAFDTQRNRIGYGGGFYDRYLKEHTKKFYKTAVCFDYQIVDNIPAEEFDIRPDMIITDRRII